MSFNYPRHRDHYVHDGQDDWYEQNMAADDERRKEAFIASCDERISELRQKYANALSESQRREIAEAGGALRSTKERHAGAPLDLNVLRACTVCKRYHGELPR